MGKTYKGVFKPKNPSKYRGDPTNIIYRSRWELLFMRYLDNNSGIKEWASEELIIPYRSPIDGRVHRYFPDFSPVGGTSVPNLDHNKHIHG